MNIYEQQQKWSQIITEELGVQDKSKVSWMAEYARNHEIFEGMQAGNAAAGIYATPLNTLGAGNPMMPLGVAGADGFNANGIHGAGIGNSGADFHNPMYKVGSGDIPMSTLTMSLEIAAVTIGLELVPVIPAPGPWALLTYEDFPYAGGKLGRINETWADGKGENKPIYIKILGCDLITKELKAANVDHFVRGKVVTANSVALGTFIGFSRIDNSPILEVTNFDANKSIADLVVAPIAIDGVVVTKEGATVRADLVSTAADHIQGFSNFFKDQDGKGSLDPMTRAQNETGTGNTIGTRIFSKFVQMGAYEVTGAVTRQQLQDFPLYGIDVIGKVTEAMQNRISQEINNRILDRLFKLGVENYKTQRDYQGVDLNLFLGDATHPSLALSSFKAYPKYVGLDDKPVYQDTASTIKIHNAVQNTAAENVTTHQRRIMSRVLAAANLIANVSRYGRGNWVVTNTQVLSALQDCAGYVVAPMQNTLVQDGSRSLYFAGSLAGLNIYVDPYMTWEDTRICVGRKGDGNTPGVIFMPWILADTVQIVAEGTMAPKLLTNSRFQIVDAGFHTAQNYYTFMVDSANDSYLI
jgi:hypothetical protein